MEFRVCVVVFKKSKGATTGSDSALTSLGLRILMEDYRTTVCRSLI